MTGSAVVIVGIGMTTPVGLTAAETAASARSRTPRFVQSAIHGKTLEPLVLAEVPEDALPPLSDDLAPIADLTGREQRLLRLATRPIRECLAPLAELRVRVGLCLALPEMETTRPLNRAAFLPRLAAQVDGAFDGNASDSSHVGRAGGLIAVGQAVLAIQAGQREFMIAGGVDTYRDPYVLGTLDVEQRVKSDAHWDGFIPGEGAGFLLLASATAAAARGLPALARVSPVASGFEPGHMYSEETYRGDGLAGTLRHLIESGALDAPVGEVFSSMTGESHWAKEWGVAFLRTRAAFRETHGMHHPADSFGDTGAASGPLMVGLAALGIRRGYYRPPALAYCSSDRGARAAVLVSS